MRETDRAAATAIDILLVEADGHFARRVDTLLSEPASPSFHLVCVTSLGQALEILAAGNFDVVLLDLDVADAAGLSGLGTLRRSAGGVPIIVLTGSEDDQLALGALHEGADDYLLKATLERHLLTRSIRYAVERRRSIRELTTVSEQLRRANHDLERLALVDPLTELLNRRGLQQALSREIEQVRRSGIQVLVILIDIDDFKRINDSLGHSVGDVALKEIARKLKESVRSADYVARLGGDEFMLLLPHAKEADVPRIAERLRLGIATTIIQLGSGALRLTASFGVAMLSPDTPSIDELVSRTHQILRRSKQEGKNRVSFEGDAFESTERRLRQQSDMCLAIARGERIISVRQPILRLSDGQTVAVEFLSRVSDGTMEMPDSFFRMCTERNLLTLADHQCLRLALTAAEDLPPGTRAHVNLFPSTILGIPAEHILEDFPSEFAPNRFCIEISEQQILGEPSHLIQPVRALRAAGMKIAIDDVGYGNSCVESLVLLEPDVIKIDKRCIKGLAADAGRRRSMTRYLRIAEELAAEVIAEGIEDRDDLRALRELGVEYGQGFLWGMPA